MPTAKKEFRINLLPQKEFEKSIWGRTLRWMLSSFRVIVIATEMIVMAAFLSRFWLDAKNSDLNEVIAQKKATISSFSETEKAFRNFQNQIDVFAKTVPPVAPSKYLNLITSLAPTDVTLNSVSESEGSIQIVGSSGSEQSASQFLKNLSVETKFKDVTLTKIDSSKDNPAVIVFTIKLWH